MRITLARADLDRALDRVASVVERRTTIPVLANIKLDAQIGTLAITATDLDIQARALVTQCEIEDGGTAITAPAAQLRDIVKKLPANAQVTLAWDGDDAPQIRIQSGRSRFTLQALPAADFPELSAAEPSHRFTLAADKLREIIARVRTAISTEETRYYLNGVFLHTIDGADGPMLRAVATDGHKMARYEMIAPAGADGLPGVIVPRKTIDEIAKMVDKGDDPVAIEVSAVRIRLARGDATIDSKLIDGAFPDYQRVIPAAGDKLAVLDSDALAAAVDRVSTIASERGHAVKFSFGGETGLSLSCRSADHGDASDEIEADYAGPSIDIGFNAKYVGELLAAMDGDQAQIRMSEPGAPTIWRASETAPTLYVLMPMRV